MFSLLLLPRLFTFPSLEGRQGSKKKYRDFSERTRAYSFFLTTLPFFFFLNAVNRPSEDERERGVRRERERKKRPPTLNEGERKSTAARSEGAFELLLTYDGPFFHLKGPPKAQLFCSRGVYFLLLGGASDVCPAKVLIKRRMSHF